MSLRQEVGFISIERSSVCPSNHWFIRSSLALFSLLILLSFDPVKGLKLCRLSELARLGLCLIYAQFCYVFFRWLHIAPGSDDVKRESK